MRTFVKKIREIILSGVLRNLINILFRLLVVSYLGQGRPSNRLISNNLQNIREKIRKIIISGVLRKSRENFVQAAGCPVPAWDKDGRQIFLSWTNSQHANIREIIQRNYSFRSFRNQMKILFRLLVVPNLHGARVVIKLSYLKKFEKCEHSWNNSAKWFFPEFCKISWKFWIFFNLWNSLCLAQQIIFSKRHKKVFIFLWEEISRIKILHI